jgi:hypothetical protein
MNMNFEPMQAELIGGWEMLLVLGFFFCVVVIPVAGVVAIVYFIVNRGKSNPQPAPTLPVPPVAPAPASPLPPMPARTEVTPRKCPQCGAVLQPDAPEGLCPACLLQRGFATEAGPKSDPSSFVPPTFSELSQLFPQLEIIEMLGRGGMGAVYKARQPRLDRLVALKILAPEKQGDPQFAERFQREARALARLSHPNIVTVHDFGEVQGHCYLLMEFVDGLTLRQVLQNGKLTPAEALNIVPKICEALQYAHGQGVVHRDIKPENILLDKQGRVKIADFGIAKIAGLEGKDFSLTGARDVMGTPVYMAPEQVEKPQSVDHRADIYSLGVVFYEMLTGELPLGKFAPPSQKVQVDVRLDEVVLHALEKEPARRYQQASQVKTDVENVSKLVGGTPAPLIAMAGVADASDKVILPAFLLAFFFGVFGAHRFYAGKFVTGCLQFLALCSCILWICVCAAGAPQPLFGLVLAGSICGCLAWATIDWLLLLCKAFSDGKGRRMTRWLHENGSAPRPVAAQKVSAAGTSTAPKPAAGQTPPAGAVPISPLAAVKNAEAVSPMITAPAVALMIAGALNLVTLPLKMLFLFPVILGWVHLPVTLVASGVMLFGGYQMLKGRSYAWAMAAGIAGIFACGLISLVVGIWALVVLARDDVKAAFGAAPVQPTAPAQPGRFWRGFAGAAAGLILILLLLAVVVFAAAIYVVPRIAPAMAASKPPTAAELEKAGIRQEDGEFRKDSSQTFPLDADGRFSIDNVDGPIEIHGWNSNAVALKIRIHGRTPDAVEAVKINVDSQPQHAGVHTDLGDHLDSGWNWLRLIGRDKGTVDYVVNVPRQAQLAGVHSVDGHVKIDGVSGPIIVNTVDGGMDIENAASDLKLNAVDGRISVSMDSLGAGQPVSLHSMDGHITLAVPEDADANFSVHTVDGGVTSEFAELPAEKEAVVGHKLRGKLRNGSAEVTVETVDGAVKIAKHHVTKPAATVASASAPPLSYDWHFTGQGAVTNHDFSADSPSVAAAQKWLALSDAGNFSENWRQASGLFRQAVTEATWNDQMNTFRKPLGDLISRQLISSQAATEMPGAPDGHYVVMQFQTSFAEKKSAVETVTFMLEDGQWKSGGYFIK